VIQEMQTLYPDQQAKLIMVCNAGNRSGLSAKAYRDRGYENVYVLANGIEGLPPEVFKTKN
jgi:rhodanese-related sulfurtransferase